MKKCVHFNKFSLVIRFKFKLVNIYYFQFVENPQLPQKSCKNCSNEFHKYVTLRDSVKANQMHLLDALQNELKEEEISVEEIKLEPYVFDAQELPNNYSQFCSTTIKEEESETNDLDNDKSSYESRKLIRRVKAKRL